MLNRDKVKVISFHTDGSYKNFLKEAFEILTLNRSYYVRDVLEIDCHLSSCVHFVIILKLRGLANIR